MTSTSLAKILGWLQFGVQAAGAAFAAGVPSNPLGWAGLVGSLITAVAVHASANTDGVK